MAGILQLCRHLRFILHTPIRLFDSAGSLAAPDDAEENQEDPLECDRSFMRTLLSLRQEDRPVLHYESGSVLYAIIPAEDGQTIVAGPVCCVRDSADAACAIARTHGLKRPDTYRVSYVPMDIALESVLLLFHAYSDLPLSRDDLVMQSSFPVEPAGFAAEAESGAYQIIYRLRENNSSHNSYAQEAREQKAIREGNVSALRESWAEVQTGRIGRLGKDDLTHYRNLAVVVLTLSCRSAIEGGVLPEIAYSLSDSYTMKLGELTDPIKITELFRSAEVHYAELVRDVSCSHIQNRYVLRCKERIHDRLHQRIQVSELAAELGISRCYLSQIFQREEGIRLTAYILREKVRASEYLLMTPGISLEQIAATFAFTSQSHYGQVFRRFRGITPGEFRERHQNRK